MKNLQSGIHLPIATVLFPDTLPVIRDAVLMRANFLSSKANVSPSHSVLKANLETQCDKGISIEISTKANKKAIDGVPEDPPSPVESVLNAYSGIISDETPRIKRSQKMKGKKTIDVWANKKKGDQSIVNQRRIRISKELSGRIQPDICSPFKLSDPSAVVDIFTPLLLCATFVYLPNATQELLNELEGEVEFIVYWVVRKMYPALMTNVIIEYFDCVKHAILMKFRKRTRDLTIAGRFVTKMLNNPIDTSYERIVYPSTQEEQNMIRRIIELKVAHHGAKWLHGTSGQVGNQKSALFRQHYEIRLLARSNNTAILCFVDIPLHRRDMESSMMRPGLLTQSLLMPPWGHTNPVWRDSLHTALNAVRWGWDPVRIWMHTPFLDQTESVDLKDALIQCRRFNLCSPLFTSVHRIYPTDQCDFNGRTNLIPPPWHAQQLHFDRIRKSLSRAGEETFDNQLVALKHMIEAEAARLRNLSTSSKKVDEELKRCKIYKLDRKYAELECARRAVALTECSSDELRSKLVHIGEALDMQESLVKSTMNRRKNMGTKINNRQNFAIMNILTPVGELKPANPELMNIETGPDMACVNAILDLGVQPREYDEGNVSDQVMLVAHVLKETYNKGKCKI
jgi:hypothetical protein